jgi:hypothetical protein
MSIASFKSCRRPRSPRKNEYIMKPFDKDIVTAKFQEIGLFQPVEPA